MECISHGSKANLNQAGHRKTENGAIMTDWATILLIAGSRKAATGITLIQMAICRPAGRI